MATMMRTVVSTQMTTRSAVVPKITISGLDLKSLLPVVVAPSPARNESGTYCEGFIPTAIPGLS
eukprot:gene7981-1198_t